MKTLQMIHGVPLRKIVSREILMGVIGWVETLSCGHKNTSYDRWGYLATKRRCYHEDCVHDRNLGLRKKKVDVNDGK